MKTYKETNYFLLFLIILIIFTAISNSIVEHINFFSKIITLTVLSFIPLLVEIIRGKDPIEYYGLTLSHLKKVKIKEVIFIAIAIFISFSIIDNLFFHLWKTIVNSKSKIPVGGNLATFAKSNLFFLAIFLCLSGTFVEELWFRGVIQYKLKPLKFLKRINPHFAIIVQSILFGLIHFIPIYSLTHFPLATKIYFFIYPTIVGLIIGYIKERYDSLLPGWIIHFSDNLLSVIGLTILFRL